MTIVPSVMKDDTLPKAHLGEIDGNDLPNVSSLDTELQIWKCKWAISTDHMPSSPAEALSHANESIFIVFCI